MSSGFVFPVIAALVEYYNGMKVLPDSPTIWNGDVESNQNSQQLLDPYSFTHVEHGMIWYLITGSLWWSLLIESLWEIVENSPTIINKYRQSSINQGYYGDTILNSMGDILSMAVGFWLATQLNSLFSILLVMLGIEIFLYKWIGDNLFMNVKELI